MSDTLPYFKTYPGDWRRDLGAQSLSYHARGIWFELRCMMHTSKQRGKLVSPDGTPMPDDTIARLLGLSLHDGTKTIQELIGAGVAERCPESKALMCPVMVKEERLRKIRQEAGSRGGNPLLMQDAYANLLNGDKVNRDNEYEHVPESEASKWFRELKEDPAYRGIDVAREAAKGVRWCKENNRVFNRKFFTNWLNRISPVIVPENGAPTRKALSIFELKTVLEAKTREMQDLRNRHCSEGPLSDEWTKPEYCKRYKELNREIRDLNRRIGQCH